MQIKTIEISGFVSCFNTLRKPYKKECRSNISSSLPSGDSFGIGCTGYYINLDVNDLKLLQRLIKNGDEHAKALRLINVTAEIQAPLFWWSEMDTYEVGVVNGCSESTMHTLKSEVLTYDSFEGGNVTDEMLRSIQNSIEFGDHIEVTKSLLPSGYLQTRDINFSYQTLARICKQREGHKLPQWQVFIEWVRALPLANELIINGDKTNK